VQVGDGSSAEREKFLKFLHVRDGYKFCGCGQKISTRAGFYSAALGQGRNERGRGAKFPERRKVTVTIVFVNTVLLLPKDLFIFLYELRRQ